jgi:hypothetical protein
MQEQHKIKARASWKDSGFDKFMSRQREAIPKPAGYIGGANFDILLDEMLFNRMIRFRNLSQTPQGNDPGKIYWDADNKKLMVWVDATGKWAEITYTSTSTSTSTSSTSSSSSSTSTT